MTAPIQPVGPKPRPPASVIFKTIANSISNEEPQSVREQYLASIGMTRPEWLAVADAYRGSKDNSVSSLPPGTDVSTGAPMEWRIALASTPNPADKLVMLKQLAQKNGLDPNSVQPFGKNNFVYQSQEGPRLFDERKFDPILGAVPIPTGRDLVESAPGVARGVGMMAGGAGGALLGGPLGGVPAAVGGAAIGSELLGGPVEALYRKLSGVKGPGAEKDIHNALDEMANAAATQAIFSGAGAVLPMIGKGLGMVPFDRPPGKMTTGELLDASGKAKVPLSLGELLQNRALQTIENSLRQNPASANLMGRLDEKTFSALNREAADVSRVFAGGKPVQDVAAFNTGLQQASADHIARFQATRLGMDDALTQIMATHPNTAKGVPIANVEQALAQMYVEANKSATQAAILKPVIAEAERLTRTATANNRLVPMTDLLSERRNFADESGFGTPTGTYKRETTLAYQKMWAAIREDVHAGAELAGPDAAELNRVHDQYVTMAHDSKAFANFDTFKEWASISQGKTPTQFALSIAQSKNPSKMVQQVRANLRPGQWDDIVGAVAQDMGRASSGAQPATGALDVWSPDAFRTNLDKLRSVKGTLFGQTPYREAYDRFENMGKLADDLSTAFKTYGRSQTGTSLQGHAAVRDVGRMGSAALGVLVGMETHNFEAGMATAGMGIIAPWAAAKLLTNENANRVIATFARGLTYAAKESGTETAAKFAATNGPKLIARMYALQKMDPLMRESIDQYLEALRNAGFPGSDPITYQRLTTPQATFQPRP